MQTAARALVDEAEFLSLPERVEKIELIDGEVNVSPSPTLWHQELIRRLVVALSQYRQAQNRGITVAHAPLDVRFGDSRILQPDVFVSLTRLPLDAEGPITRVPEICVEVVSANRVYDRITKRMIYAVAGVAEYWVVEPAGLVERWTGAGLTQAQELRDRLQTPLLPGFDLLLTDLFDPDL